MLEKEYETQEEIPSGYAHLYEEKDGKYVLKSGSLIKTTDDITRLQKALKTEREEHKESKEKLKAFDDMDADELSEKLTELETLRASKGDKATDEQIRELSEIKAKYARLDRDHAKAQKELADKQKAVEEYETRNKQRKIRDDLRAQAIKLKVDPVKMEDFIELGETKMTVSDDGEVVTRDGNIPVDVWVSEKKEASPYFWPESEGAGSTGGSGGATGGANPFAPGSVNLTEQLRMKTSDPDKAKRLEAAAEKMKAKA